ncbi:MAG: 4-hydroxy-tetrahydrodipicolinate synthase [Trichococcus flocculiformis]|jgi:4-hydroxy-tetrahydrodipicolinate synthase|uniref:4-hydroxy-tetrahydrodipicolinate synthase n=3 Tax=root TaxID=1 RepID=A0A143Y3U3_9LACT|nr:MULTISPECIES: 4-hydroxy-tetrahydrodipicolinate synthase [Trichococcus]MBP6164428.1 4-hydroxy-tetrahydrodipicolinate synthase [Trichococcus sp.]MBP6246864.1 4-hydroxy-tetrahydrodipicolinate synthase [Trichococcus sp.]MBP7129128.1 4-hydroxy-tetrahydrodipicolinate synthase [Trichococcus sp.]MBP8682547.1 4-hydroxy-tetrahydrodipicolinate synthase [Trichococcus sp.]MBP9594737.1 4-hydroxy-tetrahydrodipicolinate synthase [Trichococcus sp.]
MAIFEGSGVAIVTPFKDTENQEINYEVLEELIEFQIANGTDSIIIAGTTGEASTLTDEEQLDLIRFTVEKVNGRVPVIGGAGSNDTRHGVGLTRAVEATGVDAILSVTPYYNKTSQKGLIEHYKAIANSVKVPIVLYNVPGRTGQNITPESLVELAKIDNIVSLKDATGNFGQAVDNLRLLGDRLDIYSGNDDTIIPLMSLGAKGVISVLANIAPKATAEMTHAWLDGDIKKAAAMQAEYKELIDCLFVEPNPIPVKAGMQLLGFNVGPMRLPLTDADQAVIDRLAAAMKKVGLI